MDHKLTAHVLLETASQISLSLFWSLWTSGHDMFLVIFKALWIAHLLQIKSPVLHSWEIMYFWTHVFSVLSHSLKHRPKGHCVLPFCWDIDIPIPPRFTLSLIILESSTLAVRTFLEGGTWTYVHYYIKSLLLTAAINTHGGPCPAGSVLGAGTILFCSYHDHARSGRM